MELQRSTVDLNGKAIRLKRQKGENKKYVK